MMNMRKISTMFCGLWLMCVSCGDMDLLDFDKISDKINWKPDLVAPIGYGSFSMWTLLEQSVDSTIVNVDNQLMIRYTESNIYQMSATEFFDLPPQDVRESLNIPVNIPEMPLGVRVNLTEDIELNSEGILAIEPGEGYELHKLVTSMFLNYSFPKMPFDYNVSLVLENIKSHGESLVINERVINMVNRSVNYSNLLFDMQDAPNTVSYRIVITIPAGQDIVLSSGLNIALSFGLSNFSFEMVAGKLKPIEIEIPQDEFKIDVDFLNELSGNFLFADPRLDLVVSNNGIGVPIEVDMDFTGYGDGKSVVFEGVPLRFIGNTTENMVTETHGYNKDNSNIAELLSLPPTERIVYGGMVNVNPEGGVAEVYKNARVSVSAKIEIPLTLTADSLIYTNTIKDIDISDAEKIVRAGMTLKVLNGIPLQVNLEKLVLTDYYNEPLDTVFVKNGRLEAAEDKGGTITAKSSVLEVELSEKNISHLNNTKNIQLVLRASTGNDGRAVSIKGDAMLEVTMILRAKIDAGL